MPALKEFTAEDCRKTQLFYQRNPIAYMIDLLDVKGEHVWSKMVEIAESVRDNQKTCVESGHSVSKDYTASRLALWFLACFGPNCTVVVSGPGQNQVENIFFREVREAYNKAKKPYGGKLTTCKLDLDDKWFMIGFTAAEDPGTDENTRTQGFHNEYVLVILTEAAGVPVSVRKAVDGLIITNKHRLLTYGNPTKAQGSFAEDSEDPSFHHINISVKDTPNFKEGREVIPGVSGREYEKSVRDKYGVDSNEYAITVLGRKPEFTAGTYLGKGLAKAEQEGRIGSIIHDITQPVYTFSDLGDTWSAWWFVQFIKGFVHLVDFYMDSEGQGIPVYAKMLQDKPYKYGGHFSLPDIFPKGSNQKAGITGQYTVDIASSLKVDFERIDLPSRDDCIRCAQDLMNVCKFSAAAQEGVDGLYDWRKRKNEALSTPDKPVYFDEAVKTWGRHCLIAGTMVKTTKGDKPIETITTDDWVITPLGKRKVLASWCNGFRSELLEVKTNTGKTLTLTSEHKVFFDNKLDRADTLCCNAVLNRNTFLRRLLWKMLSHSVDSSLSSKEVITSGLAPRPCIKPFGNTIMGQCLSGIGYITKMIMHSITTSAIWKYSQRENINFCTELATSGMGVRKISSIWMQQEKRPVYGTEAKRGWLSIKHWDVILGRNIKSQNLKSVWFAGRNTQHTGQQIHSTVRQNAVKEFMRPQGRSTEGIRLILKNAIALFARSLLNVINILKPELVVKIAQLNYSNKPVPVYDLTIDIDHCYYANGLLVSNCGDAFCGVAVSYRYTAIGGKVLGSLEHNLPSRTSGNSSPYRNNVLTRGMKLQSSRRPYR